MVFDVTLVLGKSYTMEYDSSGGIVQPDENMDETESYLIPNKNVGKFTIIKDPVVNHINLYSIELYDLPLWMVGKFKNNEVKYIIIRLGSGMTEQSIGEVPIANKIPNFDYGRILIKPVQLIEQAIQDDKNFNDVIVKGISILANALLMDASFASELEDIQSYGDAQTITVPNAGREIDYSTSAKTSVSPNAPVSVRNYNPGNIIKTNINWDGEENSNNSSRFEKFATPELGFKALMKNILAKQKQGKTTIKDLIYVWAPPNENNSMNYAQFVANALGKNINDTYDVSDLATIAKAISWMEGDNKVGYYTNEMINDAAKMLGINSSVGNISTETVAKTDYKYGSGTEQIVGTNINQAINIYNYVKGSDILNTILNRMKEKYGIEVDVSAMIGMTKSMFIYKDIQLPGISVIEILKKIHKEYPAYICEVPWIIDDLKFSSDVNKIGKSWYTEIGLLNINSLNIKSLNNTFENSTKSAIYDLLNVMSTTRYYKEPIERVEAQTIIHKDITTGIETIFKGTSSEDIATVQDPANIAKNELGIFKIKINTNKVIHIETSYTAEEFKKRLDVYKALVYSNPSIIRCKIAANDPLLFEFGYAYTFNKNDNLNKVTPYKIKMEFTNVENKYNLEYEIDFYKGIGISDITYSNN